MKELIALATVSYYNNYNYKTETEKIVLTEVKNFADAMERIEKYYSNELTQVDIELYEGPFLFLTDEEHAAIKERSKV